MCATAEQGEYENEDDSESKIHDMVSFIWMGGQIVEHRNMNHRRGSTYGLRDKFGMGSPDREYGSSCRETVVSGCLGNGGTTDFLCSIRIFYCGTRENSREQPFHTATEIRTFDRWPNHHSSWNHQCDCLSSPINSLSLRRCGCSDRKK